VTDEETAVLKGIDPLLVPRLLYRLAAMGHGDEIAVVDRNYPAYSAGPEVIELPGVDVTGAVRVILQLLPLDTFVDQPVLYMQPVNGEDALPIHREVAALAGDVEQRHVEMQGLTRQAFYDRARRASAVVSTTENRPYGCFLLVKGVIG
jgi:L-fucose mutarotase